MPKITDAKVFDILRNDYFDHHAAMHLARERMTLPDGSKLPLFLPPHDVCNDCDKMIEAGQDGSGTEFLQMHHEMIRVFRFLLEQQGLRILAEWVPGTQAEKGVGYWRPGGKPDDLCYTPLLWDLDDHRALPHEIVGMLNVTDDQYLAQVFSGVKKLTGLNAAQIDCSDAGLAKAIDKLGKFIERGVDLRADPNHGPDGSGFHNTMHEYLAAREGKASQGAEMNKLRKSMFNDYFWSLHLWIDGQYGRLLEKCGKPFYTIGLDPAKLDMFTHSDPHAPATGMSMPS